MSFQPLDRLRQRVAHSETTAPLLVAIAVGLLAGFGAIVLRVLIAGVQWFFFGQGQHLGEWLGLPPALANLHYFLAPPLGMVLVTLLVRRWAPEARGHGVPEVQYAVRMRGGRIRPRVAVAKALASAISIGSGGSVGREGPIVQIGSALGSSVGQLLGVTPEQLRVLVACGAAGAIGATFNAPIAGTIFGLEVILTSFVARSFGLVVISAVTATAVSQAALGREPAFHLVETFTLVSDWEFVLYLLLGVLLGVVATAYVRSVYWFEDAFERWQRGPVFKAIVGGLAVGAMGFFGSAHIFGVGHEGVELALLGSLTTGLMLSLVALKILATSITLGAGGSGGVFAPALFIGAMGGGAFGRLVNAWLPLQTAPAGAYALVGMGALFAAAAHAPMTGIIILFEMTDNYEIILPLMFSVVVAYLISSRVHPDSIYSLKLRRRGALTPAGGASSVLDLVLVEDTMSRQFETLSPALTLEEMARFARSRRTRSWPVVDDQQRLIGIITDTDLEQAVLAGEMEGRTVGDVMTRTVLSCEPGDTLRVAFRLFAQADVQQIPVVEDASGRAVVGVLRRHDMMWAYQELSEEHRKLLERAGGSLHVQGSASVQIEVHVPPVDQGGRSRLIRHLRLPPQCLVVLLRRADRVIVPGGDTMAEPGDTLVVLTTEAHEPELRGWAERWDQRQERRRERLERLQGTR
ncbi:MAG: chloride channel protein [Gemmatimonadota bacterium]